MREVVNDTQGQNGKPGEAEEKKPLSKKKHNNNIAAGNSSGNDTGSEGNSNKTPPPANNGPDPSVFPKDPNFHQSLHGIAYSPEGSQLPNCGNSLGWLICIIGQLCFK